MPTNSTLLTEQNTSRVERLVKSAAAERFGRGKARPVFEHDQWWWWVIIPEDESDSVYSVVDAYPGIGSTGLDFEQVS